MTTNLTEKFEAFQQLSIDQHTELMEALASIATALPPQPSGATLADVIAAIEAGTEHLNVIRSNVILIWDLLLNYIPYILGAVNTTATNTDILINNTSLNAQIAHVDAISNRFALDAIQDTQRTQLANIIAAIYATACPCVDGPSPLAPPLNTDPLGLSTEEKCQRVQAFLAMFGSIIDSIANFGGAATSITGATLGAILGAAATTGGLVGGEVGAVAGPPGVVAGVIIGAIGSAIGALGASALQTLATQWHTEPLIDQLRDALFDVNDAASGDARFHAAVNASNVLSAPWKAVINALWWSSWSNDLYNPAVTIDIAGFDGTICTASSLPGTGCGSWPHVVMSWSVDEMVQISTPYGSRLVPNWAKYGIPVVDDGRPGELSAVIAPCEVWSYEATGATLQFYQSNPSPYLNSFEALPDPVGDLRTDVSKVIFWSYRDPWTLTLTPPSTVLGGGGGLWGSSAMHWSTSEMLMFHTPYGDRWYPDWSKYGITMVLDSTDPGRSTEFTAVHVPENEAWTYTAIGSGLQFYQSSPDPDLYSYDTLTVPSGTMESRADGLCIFWSVDGPFDLTLTPP